MSLKFAFVVFYVCYVPNSDLNYHDAEGVNARLHSLESTFTDLQASAENRKQRIEVNKKSNNILILTGSFLLFLGCNPDTTKVRQLEAGVCCESCCMLIYDFQFIMYYKWVSSTGFQ